MPNTIRTEKQKLYPFLLFLFTFILMLVSMISNLKWGQAHISWRVLYEALTYQGDSKEHLYIQTLRLPRTLTAFVVGAQLAVAGLLTQLITRNPLASPHIFGINAGASLAVVSGLVFFAGLSFIQSIFLAFIGAALGALLVWALAGTEQKQYVRLALAGIAVHFLLSSLTEGLIILNQHATDSMMFWLVGSVSNAAWGEFGAIWPFTVFGLLATICLLPSFKLLLLDDSVAAGLGSRIHITRLMGVLLVIVLSGSAVAICGPIAFLCLIVPHIAGSLIGRKLPLLVPYTALLGGCLLIAADFISKFIAFPFESPVGIITAAVGGPFFIYLARKQRRGR